LPNRHLGDGIPQFVGEMEGTVTMNEWSRMIAQ
jgi:hypothetical protein